MNSILFMYSPASPTRSPVGAFLFGFWPLHLANFIINGRVKKEHRAIGLDFGIPKRIRLETFHKIHENRDGVLQRGWVWKTKGLFQASLNNLALLRSQLETFGDFLLLRIHSFINSNVQPFTSPPVNGERHNATSSDFGVRQFSQRTPTLIVKQLLLGFRIISDKAFKRCESFKVFRALKCLAELHNFYLSHIQLRVSSCKGGMV